MTAELSSTGAAAPSAPPAPTSASTPRTRICVYCGSSAGTKPAHIESARALGRAMARENIDLVYGGGTVGLMGEVAKTLVAINGPNSVHGIIPEALINYERDDTYGTTVASTSTSTSTSPSGMRVPSEEVYGRTTVVRDMHTRKKQMVAEVIAGGPGSGFVALSGGFGTLEELAETTTWNQLGIHDRGVVVLNIDGFYDGLLAWVRNSVQEGFIAPANGAIIVEAKTAEEAIVALREYKVSPATMKLEWGEQ
jgi:uncharacterized protein (TIGR00730 family)